MAHVSPPKTRRRQVARGMKRSRLFIAQDREIVDGRLPTVNPTVGGAGARPVSPTLRCGRSAAKERRLEGGGSQVPARRKPGGSQTLRSNCVAVPFHIRCKSVTPPLLIRSTSRATSGLLGREQSTATAAFAYLDRAVSASRREDRTVLAPFACCRIMTSRLLPGWWLRPRPLEFSRISWSGGAGGRHGAGRRPSSRSWERRWAGRARGRREGRGARGEGRGPDAGCWMLDAGRHPAAEREVGREEATPS
jgi:hypothetical protein